ncbi:zinc finger CCHC domain-containing protein 14 isoform X2 [Takifugu flavidus]|uniref:zinc finger CCHC domain-containing protein 14 isoform X2 n=1 Tax=Takifugu flavidus TaxID=433684 RepID=UPI00254475F8|nr:zinc finger CCHC domain-containing protein 14 isoform X2 [Takifugu flavidus]
MVETWSCVQREGIYRWFSALASAKRAEFLCGLLDLCVPIELRFLGSCLEDLARKDYHSLRDAEIKANNPTDLSGLANITDEVVRSKLLVSVALLASDNREAAGVLYRTLTHIDTVINNYGLSLNDVGTEEQFLLLFTMASHHPAFTFHQKQVLRQQLDQIHDIFQRRPREVPAPGSGVKVGPDQEERPELRAPHPDPRPHPPSPLPSHLPSPPSQVQDVAAPSKSHQGKAGKVVVDRVLLRGRTQKSEDVKEYLFEARWSDGFVSSVIRTQQEVVDLLSQLSKAFPDEGLDHFLPQSAELDPRCLTALPGHVLQHASVQLFFTSTRPPSHSHPATLPSPPTTALGTPACVLNSNSSLGCMVQYRGPTRAIYRVASVQPVISTHSPVLQHPSPRLSSLPPPLPASIPPHKYSSQLSSLPPAVLALPAQCSIAASGEPSSQMPPPSYPPPQHHLHQPSGQQLPSLFPPACQAQTLPYSQYRSQAQTQTLCQGQPGTPEQNGILDWLRRLRLHKYYPVFKQLTMEEFLGLTEEDLNKYDLTQGAKKKLKTQLELQKSFEEMKLEKLSCSSVARVTPSTHMGSSTYHTSSAGELQVDVDSGPHHHPVATDGGSSGSPCSPRTLYCDSTGDRTKDVHRRLSGQDVPAGGSESDQSCQFLLSSSCPSGSARPTAQVLPVQTNSALPLSPSSSFSLTHSSYPPQARDPQSSLSPVSNPPQHILASYRKSWVPLLSPAEDRVKLQTPGLCGAGPGFSGGVSGMKQENLLSRLGMDRSLALQDSLLCQGLAGAAAGLMVETSSATTSTSNSLHHVSHPPLHFHLSSSSSPSPSAYYSCLPISISLHPLSSGSAGVPAAAASGSSYHPRPPTSSTTPSSAPSSHQGPGQTSPVCACASCGCQDNCGPYGALPGYAMSGYLQPLSADPSLFSLGPLLHLSPVVATSNTGATSLSYPIMVPSSMYRHSPASHEQHQAFAFYQPHSLVGTGSQKRAAGALSCYNCGSSGHKAEACKQPAMEPAQQGTFRLKYHPHSDSKNSRD